MEIFEKFKVNFLSQILFILGLILILFGLYLYFRIRKEKNKYSLEFLEQILDFSMIFPGEKVFIWPLLYCKNLDEKSKNIGFKIDFYFDKFLGKFSNKFFKKNEDTFILKDFKNKKFEEKASTYSCFILLKKPNYLEIFEKELREKKIKLITLNFEIDNLSYKSKKVISYKGENYNIYRY